MFSFIYNLKGRVNWKKETSSIPVKNKVRGSFGSESKKK